MKTKIFSLLAGALSSKVSLLFFAALPIFELRLAVPLGILKFGLPVWQVYLLSLAGNMIPVLPLLLGLKYFFHRLEKVRGIGRFFRWWFRRVERKTAVIERYGFWGLVFFVAIPLPVTGAWTGACAATLVEMEPRKAFMAILTGVSVAGLIMTVLSLIAQETIASMIRF